MKDKLRARACRGRESCVSLLLWSAHTLVEASSPISVSLSRKKNREGDLRGTLECYWKKEKEKSTFVYKTEDEGLGKRGGTWD